MSKPDNLGYIELPGINAKTYWPDSKYMISYGFTIRSADQKGEIVDRHYFRFDDPLNNPYERALQALVYYREYDMNMNRDLLISHTQAVDNVLAKDNFGVKDLIDFQTLNTFMKERLKLPKQTDLMYKVAAVIFFDQFESPLVYEFKYGEKKIMEWKKNVSMKGFFLQQPLMILMPYLRHAGENLDMFSQMTDKVTQRHLDSLYSMLSPQQKITLQSSLKSLLAQ